MMMEIWLSVLSFSVIAFMTVILSVRMIIRHLRNVDYVNNFINYISLFEYYAERSFNITYKDRVIVFSVEGTRPNEGEIDAIIKDFQRLMLKLMGPKLVDELTKYYGDDITLYRNMVEYFNSRYEDDEIREASMEKMISKDII